MSWVWVLIAAIVLLALFSGNGNKKNTRKADSHWIYHPHVIDPDNRKPGQTCPKCGTKMIGKTEKDEDEWFEEEEELDMILDDD